MSRNADVLTNAGLLHSVPTSGEYQALIDSLTEEELAALVSIKEKLDKNGIPWVPLTAHGPRALMPL
jgi:hypothetical protein